MNSGQGSATPPRLLGGWVRSTEWLDLPSPAAQEFLGLFAVFDNDSNYLAFHFAGAYTVDWGDGSATENIATGVTAEHQYTYSSISGSTQTTMGYRQVIVHVTPQAGQNITNINLPVKHSALSVSSQYTIPWLDILINCPNLTSQTMGGISATILMRYLERCYVQSIGAATNLSYMFAGCRALQSVPDFATGSNTTFEGMFYNCRSLRTAPGIDTHLGTNFNSMFGNCSDLQSVPLYNTSAGTLFNATFTSCESLITIPLWDTHLGTDFTNTFQNCSALKYLPALNTAAGTTFTTMLQNCYSLAVAPFAGTTKTISYVNCELSRAKIVDIFNALASGVTAQTITVTGNVGSASLSGADLAIATGKGWTVTQ